MYVYIYNHSNYKCINFNCYMIIFMFIINSITIHIISIMSIISSIIITVSITINMTITIIIIMIIMIIIVIIIIIIIISCAVHLRDHDAPARPARGLHLIIYIAIN